VSDHEARKEEINEALRYWDREKEVAEIALKYVNAQLYRYEMGLCGVYLEELSSSGE